MINPVQNPTIIQIPVKAMTTQAAQMTRAAVTAAAAAIKPYHLSQDRGFKAHFITGKSGNPHPMPKNIK